MIIEREYHKGEWCIKIDGICQEGYCDRCEYRSTEEIVI
jgi:hypothetical protein